MLKNFIRKCPRKAVRYLTDYSVNAGNSTVTQWKKLYKFLFVKYVDGNVKEKTVQFLQDINT